MPNIEIYGFLRKFGLDWARAEQVEAQIWSALDGMPGLEHIVVTKISSEVRNSKLQGMPYIRLLYTPETKPEELVEIERRLDDVDLDLEVELLIKFRERRSVREKKASNSIGPGFRDPHSGAIV